MALACQEKKTLMGSGVTALAPRIPTSRFWKDVNVFKTSMSFGKGS